MTESTTPAQCSDADWKLARKCGLFTETPGTNAWDAALGRFAEAIRAGSGPLINEGTKAAAAPSASAQQAEPMLGAPERVYLVVGEFIEDGDDFKNLSGVCWCEDSQFDTDIEYVRVDLAAPAPSATPPAAEGEHE